MIPMYVTTKCHDTEGTRITSFHSSQGPTFNMPRSALPFAVRAHASSQGFVYVVLSVPQTGLYILGQGHVLLRSVLAAIMAEARYIISTIIGFFIINIFLPSSQR